MTERYIWYANKGNSTAVAWINFESLNCLVFEELYEFKRSEFIGILGGALGIWLGLNLLDFFKYITVVASMARRHLLCATVSSRTGSKKSTPELTQEHNYIPDNMELKRYHLKNISMFLNEIDYLGRFEVLCCASWGGNTTTQNEK